jgi:hypothetical protein
MIRTRRKSTYLFKIFVLTIILFSINVKTFAQQFSLYNSRTLYDSFENPSQRAYQVDTSRRFAFNFFIPTISINSSFTGPAEAAFKTLLYDGMFNGRDITIGDNKHNNLTLNSNNYVAMLRMLKTVKKYKEIGLSWQIRNDGRVKVSNDIFAVFDDYRLFNSSSLQNIFSLNGYNQSYHQFSFTYRQNYTKRLAIGAKLSLLSGISYTQLKVSQSEINMDEAADVIDVSLRGTLRSNFKFDNFQRKMADPNFRNPGLSFTAGASYKLRDGYFVLGNLKDIGLIKWSKDSYEYNFNTGKILIDNASNQSADNRLADSLDKNISSRSVNKSYVSALNGKAEILINKDFGNYRPNLILSKSIYYKGGDIALVNNYHYKNYVFTGMADYNTNGFLQLGGQFMVKTPNIEFYMGSDQLVKSLEMLKNFTKNETIYPSGYTGVSFYMGFALKFGRVLEHPANATQIPGFMEDPASGFIKKLFRKKN